MSDQACKSEEQHRIDTLQEMANTEHQLRMARTQYEAAKGELVRASEALLEWQEQWNKERRAVFACYPDAMPVDNVVEDARATMDRFLAQSPAALTPTPDFIAEQETAREQLEREPEQDWTNGGEDHLDAACAELLPDEQDDASEFAEPVEEAPALNEAMQDEREEPVALAQPEWNEPQPNEGYAPVTNPEAHIQAVEAERYAQPTNPDADAIARAHDWYDPKAVAERNRFNPWGGVSNLFGKPKVDA